MRARARAPGLAPGDLPNAHRQYQNRKPKGRKRHQCLDVTRWRHKWRIGFRVDAASWRWCGRLGHAHRFLETGNLVARAQHTDQVTCAETRFAVGIGVQDAVVNQTGNGHTDGGSNPKLPNRAAVERAVGRQTKPGEIQLAQNLADRGGTLRAVTTPAGPLTTAGAGKMEC